MRITLIHNPGAGGTGDDDAARLIALLGKNGHEVRYQSSKEKGWKAALEEPADAIAVAGGDGIVGRVAKRMAGRDVPVAPLPGGTANNIARTLGLAGRPWEAIVRGWQDGRIVTLDVGVATGPWGERKVMEGVGAGLFAASIEHADRSRTLENLPHADAKIAYALQLLKERLEHSRPVAIEAQLDGADVSGEYLMFEAMIIPFIGPNLFLAPDIKPGDGCLELVLLGEKERERLREYLAHWQNGKSRLPVLPSRHGKHLRMTASGLHLHIDDKPWPRAGEPAPRGDLIEVKLEGNTTRFLAPASKKSS
ncbi:MAG TPA: diacylglycerol kinase family protein [Burkholderiales bacterium]|jgi:diacylglycerol kinase family enzyme|nr:diacylglycerol kinase family protein [Burkholderiales bacterium]